VSQQAKLRRIPPARPVHWYHIWAGDGHHGSNWREPAEEHFAALREAEFSGAVMIGLTGGWPEHTEVTRWLDGHWPDWKYGVASREGFEMGTLNALHEYTRKMYVHAATPIFYAHTKGAFQDEPGNHAWRRAMNELVYRWRDCVDYLDAGYDAVGLHWLTPQEFPGLIGSGKPMFGGNFWWATAGYLSKLDPPGGPERNWSNRYTAEAWMGQNDPKVVDLKPGWPSEYWMPQAN
jgi:hypothetical protein